MTLSPTKGVCTMTYPLIVTIYRTFNKIIQNVYTSCTTPVLKASMGAYIPTGSYSVCVLIYFRECNQKIMQLLHDSVPDNNFGLFGGEDVEV